MAGRANCLLAVAGAAAIVVAGWMPAFADDTIATPAQEQHEQAAPSVPAAAPLIASSARAEMTRTAPSKPRVIQPGGVPARPVIVAERERCWFLCRQQMVLMLGVAY